MGCVDIMGVVAETGRDKNVTMLGLCVVIGTGPPRILGVVAEIGREKRHENNVIMLQASVVIGMSCVDIVDVVVKTGREKLLDLRAYTVKEMGCAALRAWFLKWNETNVTSIKSQYWEQTWS